MKLIYPVEKIDKKPNQPHLKLILTGYEDLVRRLNQFFLDLCVPISTSFFAANNQSCWESALLEVEYLFVGNGRRNQRQFTEGHHDYKYASIGVLYAAPKLENRSGRYRNQDAVPT
ncbi:MAG: hypothetical protein PUP93_24595 [Rhizonema sp. NSF051]|nr:hypothetical protein [Rhizonema sp. NSF051]